MIARQLALLMEGSLTVESEKGQGSTFTFTMPPHALSHTQPPSHPPTHLLTHPLTHSPIHPHTHTLITPQLVIARQLALLMEGSLTVESEKGQGSTFTFTMPTVPTPASEAKEKAPFGDSQTNGNTNGNGHGIGVLAPPCAVFLVWTLAD